jgi:hypothetical protein
MVEGWKKECGMEKIRTEVMQNDAAGKRDAGDTRLDTFSIKPIWDRA